MLEVQMLGEFALQRGGTRISDSANRSRRVWLLLGYMIYSRNRPVAPEELVELLWRDKDRSSNPLNAVKTMLHRVRACLDQIEEGAGHQLIVRRGGSYAWNPDVPITVDVERFESLCKSGAAAGDEEARLTAYLEALPIYKGNFLAKLSSEPWVIPIAAYYHGLYLQTVLETLELLEKRERWQEAVQLCRAALAQESYSEEIYGHLMADLIRLGEQQQAAKVYEDMSKLLLANFGVMPSEKSRALYREAVRTVNDHTMASGEVLDQLREDFTNGGALFCEYDIFKAIYHSFARSVARSGDAIHLALISITGSKGGELPRRSLDRVVENLQELIRSGLRRGDVAARCSLSQFILLLPQANYENSCMVCDRIIRSFNRQYPHSPAWLHVSVHPLEPHR